MNTINEKDHQRRHDGENIADAEIHQEKSIEEKETGKCKKKFFLPEPLALKNPRKEDNQDGVEDPVEILGIVVLP